MYETNKLKELFNEIREKYLKAINHMEFHPTHRYRILLFTSVLT